MVAEHPPLLARPRLVEQLRVSATRSLTVLSAPVGYGKSVLLDQWAEEPHRPPVLEVRVRAHDHRPGAPGSVATRLVDQLQSAGEAVIVVDGIDNAPDVEVEAMAKLAREAPPSLHLVVTRRSIGGVVGALVEEGGSVELRDDDLAFTATEVARHVRDVAERVLSENQVGGVLQRTHGWPVGVHLLACALREPGPVEEIVAGFSGEQRDVTAFVTERVLDELPEELRTFLVDSSVLDHLSAPICTHVTDVDEADGVLRRVHQLGLFVRLVDASGTFSVHPLIRDVLRHELRRATPDLEATLLARASGWHGARGDTERAARYLVEAEQWDDLLALVTSSGGAAFERGSPGDLLRWMDAVPPTVDPRRGDLVLRRAYLESMIGQTGRAEHGLRDLPARDRTPAETAAVEALRATWIFFDAPADEAIRSADTVLEVLDGLDPGSLPDIFGLTTPASLRTMARGSRARALWAGGQLSAGRAALAELLEDPDIYPPWRLHVLGSLALAEAWAGDLGTAGARARLALELAGAHGLDEHPGTMDVRLATASVARQRDELDAAEASLDAALEIAARGRRPVTLALHAVERGLWHLADRSIDEGLDEIGRLRRAGFPPPGPVIEGRLVATEVRLLLAAGELDRARALLVAVTDPPSNELIGLGVQLRVAMGDMAAAAVALGAFDVVTAGTRDELEHDLWTAVLALDAGHRGQATRRAARVIVWAAEEGDLRVLIDAGPAVERVLRPAAREVDLPFAARLQQALDGRDGEDLERPSLSEREREIVRYLPTRLTSAEIATRLYISLNTMRTHQQAIYRKLGVHGRDEAAARAKELGLA